MLYPLSALPSHNERPRSMPLLRKLFYGRARAYLFATAAPPPSRSVHRPPALAGWQNLQNSLSPSALSLSSPDPVTLNDRKPSGRPRLDCSTTIIYYPDTLIQSTVSTVSLFLHIL